MKSKTKKTIPKVIYIDFEDLVNYLCSKGKKQTKNDFKKKVKKNV